VPDDPREVERHIIMLTGRDDEIDKLLGVRLGADDYITKPFSPRELGARIEALVRRPRANDTAVTERTFGSLTIVPSSRQVRVAGEDVELTRIEFEEPRAHGAWRRLRPVGLDRTSTPGRRIAVTAAPAAPPASG
jgi:DNA-binding response OmpR family regulator